MVIGTLAGLFLLSIILWIVSIFSPAGMGILAGLAAGFFVWFAYKFWPVFPVFSIILAILAFSRGWWLYRADLAAFKSNLIAAVAVFAVLFLVWDVCIIYLVNREVASDLVVTNPNGKTGRALVVYHSKTGFTKKISAAFAEGLVNRGWRVEKTTASSKAPTDISGYDLLVLASPTYEWKPSARIQAYLKSLGDLKGKKVVVIITGEGYTALSLPTMVKLIKQANGNVVKSLEFWKVRPVIVNGEPADPLKIALQAGEEL